MVNCILKRLRLVRHVRRNGQDLAAIHHDLPAVNPEFQRSFQNVSDLLIVVTVLRHGRTLLQQNAGDHDVLAHDELAL